MAEFFAFKKQKDKKTKVDVYPVSLMDMGGGDGNGESYSSGTVTDDKSQVIYLEDSDKVAEVYVKEGDKVKEGDPLMRYDMEEANLNVDMKTLDVENAENDLVIAQRELEKTEKHDSGGRDTNRTGRTGRAGTKTGSSGKRRRCL